MNTTELGARPVDPPRRSLGVRARMTRVMAAGCLMVVVLGIATPSWAGPMMGC
jgi:hypothetical protein